MEFLRDIARRYEQAESVISEPVQDQAQSSFPQSPYAHSPQQQAALYTRSAPPTHDRLYQLATPVHQAQSSLASPFQGNVDHLRDSSTPRSAHWQDAPQHRDFSHSQFQYLHPAQPIFSPQLNQFYYQQPLSSAYHIPIPRLPVSLQNPQDPIAGPRLFLHPGDYQRPKILNPNPFDIAESRYRGRSRSSSVRGSSIAATRRNVKALPTAASRATSVIGGLDAAPTPQASPPNNFATLPPILQSSSPAAGGRSYDLDDEVFTRRARALAKVATADDYPVMHTVPRHKPQVRTRRYARKLDGLGHSEQSPPITSSPLPPKRVWPTTSSAGSSVTSRSAARPSKIVKLKLPLLRTKVLGSLTPQKRRSKSKALMPPPPTPKQRDFVPPSDDTSTKLYGPTEAKMQLPTDEEDSQYHKYSTRSSRSKQADLSIPPRERASAQPLVVHPTGTVSPKDIHLKSTDITSSNTAAEHVRPKLVGIVEPKVAGFEHGSNVRGYLNKSLTPLLLDGMKYIARKQPDNPIHWLGTFLLRRSADMEDIPDSSLNEEEESEDPDAEGEPDLEDHYANHFLPNHSEHDHRSWTVEPRSQHSPTAMPAADSSSFPSGELIEHEGDEQMSIAASAGVVEEDEVGHYALVNMDMEVDGSNETSMDSLAFGDEGILAEDGDIEGYSAVW